MDMKLLIAEDEKVERQALRVLISRSFPDLHIIDDAVNGIELLRKVESEQPDIVISDIEMPGLTGLEALDALKQRGFKGKLIIQTAYSNFEYARKALSLGAEAYLLKPIKKDKLIFMLETVISDLVKERKEIDEKDRYEEIFRQMRPLLDRELISALQINEISEGFTQSYLEQMLPAQSYSVLTIDRSSDKKQNSSEQLLGRESFLTRFDQFVKSQRQAIIGAPVNTRQTFLIGHRETETYRSKIDSVNLAERIRIEFPGLTIGIGKSISDIRELTQSYRESLMALKSHACRSGICHFGDLSGDEEILPLRGIEPAELQDVVFTGDDVDFKALEERITKGIASSMGLGDLKDILLNDLIETVRILPSVGGTILFKTYLDELFRIQNREDATAWFIEKLKSLAETQREKSRSIIHESVSKAQEYMGKNYMRDISLDIVAEEIGVSPYHLSHLFSQELQITYKKYLTKIRIDKAEELVKRGKYSLRELSRLCGYNNPAYFARVFQKESGNTLEEISGICVIREDF